MSKIKVKNSAGTSKGVEKSGSVMKQKKQAKEKRKAISTSSEPSTSASTERIIEEPRNYVGYSGDQIKAICEQGTGEHLTPEVATALAEDLNYKLRFVMNDAFTKARLCGKRSFTVGDINETLHSLGMEKILGVPSKPKWRRISDSSTSENIHYLEDPVVNLFDMAESSIAYVESKDAVITRQFVPLPVKRSLKTYFKLICQAVIDEDLDIRAMALKDLKSNTSIGPIIGWLYKYAYTLLKKDVTYGSLITHVLEFIDCLEENPVSGLVVRERTLKAVTSALFERFVRTNRTPSLIKPVTQVLANMCRRPVLRKMVLIKLITRYSNLNRYYAYPMMCLGNALGIEGVMAVFVTHIHLILYILKFRKDPAFINEALRAYHIICDYDIYLGTIYHPFCDIFGDGILPFWRNHNYPTTELPLEYNWLNVKKELHKSRRKLYPAANYKQKKISVVEAFPATCTVKIPKYRSKKMQHIHPTSFNLYKPNTYMVIGKRTLLYTVKSKKLGKSKCLYHTMMFHNL